MRKISEEFEADLCAGLLSPLLDRANRDQTLFLALRNDYVNFYYRGGSLLKLTAIGNHCYKAKFDLKYIGDSGCGEVINALPKILTRPEDIAAWVAGIPTVKCAMDLWFGKKDKSEREFQQVMAYENNTSRIAKSTDYFICDLEFVYPRMRFDAVAVRWPSSGSERKRTEGLGIAFIEMKYGYKSLAGTSGLASHVRDVEAFLADSVGLANLKTSMLAVFNQLVRLGRMKVSKQMTSFGDCKPEFILILANNDPDSTKMGRAISALPEMRSADLRFAVSNLFGYGLYGEGLYAKDEFVKRFRAQIGKGA